MESISAFLNMGGYAAYVWPAYGISVAVLIWLAVSSVRGLGQDRRTLELLQQANPRRAARREREAAAEHAAAGEPQ